MSRKAPIILMRASTIQTPSTCCLPFCLPIVCSHPSPVCSHPRFGFLTGPSFYLPSVEYLISLPLDSPLACLSSYLLPACVSMSSSLLTIFLPSPRPTCLSFTLFFPSLLLCLCQCGCSSLLLWTHTIFMD